jgi:hypothetical protein
MANYQSRSNYGPQFFSNVPFPREILAFSMAERWLYVDSCSSLFVQWTRHKEKIEMVIQCPPVLPPTQWRYSLFTMVMNHG